MKTFNTETPKEPIKIQNGKLMLNHLGYTLRVLMGAAIRNAECFENKKAIPISYKGAIIGTISLGKDFN